MVIFDKDPVDDCIEIVDEDDDDEVGVALLLFLTASVYVRCFAELI